MKDYFFINYLINNFFLTIYLNVIAITVYMYKCSPVATIGRDLFVSLALYDKFIKEKFG